MIQKYIDSPHVEEIRKIIAENVGKYRIKEVMCNTRKKYRVQELKNFLGLTYWKTYDPDSDWGTSYYDTVGEAIDKIIDFISRKTDAYINKAEHCHIIYVTENSLSVRQWQKNEAEKERLERQKRRYEKEQAENGDGLSNN